MSPDGIPDAGQVPGEDGTFERMTPRTWVFTSVMVLLGVVGVWMMTTKPQQFPYLTVFFYSIPSNAGISLFPHEPVLIWYGKFLNLWGLSAAAAAGTLVSAFLDYRIFAKVLNLRYSERYKSTEMYRKGHRWFYRMPFVSLVVAGFTPIPFFPFKFMVYSSKYPLWKYLLAVAVGRFPRYYLLATVGKVFQVPDWLIIAAFLGMFALVYMKKILGWLAALFRLIARPFRRRQKEDG
jgi:membrane protein YqaA with SNARE-associated domain